MVVNKYLRVSFYTQHVFISNDPKIPTASKIFTNFSVRALSATSYTMYRILLIRHRRTITHYRGEGSILTATRLYKKERLEGPKSDGFVVAAMKFSLILLAGLCVLASSAVVHQHKVKGKASLFCFFPL